MSRTSRSGRPTLRPVEKASLSEKHIHFRFIMTIVLIVVAVTAFTYGIMSFLKKDVGWRSIEAHPSAQTTCTQEFVFQYNIGDSGVAASAEHKLLTKAYTEAADTAYKIFTNESFEDVNNIAYLNKHVNEVVSIDPALYQAFELLEEYDSTYLYLAPIYEMYRGLFISTDDFDAEAYDPYRNSEIRDYFTDITEFANNPEMIHLELLGDGQVKLVVSEAYVSYAKENGITEYIDFFWLKNAFVLDYMVDVLRTQGYTKGSISSFDGFSATLDNSGTEYSFNIYDRVENQVYSAAVMTYTKPMNIVNFKNYPAEALDVVNYYEYENGEIRTPFVDSRDGFCKSAVNNLVVFSETRSCAEAALAAYGVYVADQFEAAAATALTEHAMDVIYCEGTEIYSTNSDVQFVNLYQDEKVSYQIAE